MWSFLIFRCSQLPPRGHDDRSGLQVWRNARLHGSFWVSLAYHLNLCSDRNPLILLTLRRLNISFCCFRKGLLYVHFWNELWLQRRQVELPQSRPIRCLLAVSWHHHPCRMWHSTTLTSQQKWYFDHANLFLQCLLRPLCTGRFLPRSNIFVPLRFVPASSFSQQQTGNWGLLFTL